MSPHTVYVVQQNNSVSIFFYFSMATMANSQYVSLCLSIFYLSFYISLTLIFSLNCISIFDTTNIFPHENLFQSQSQYVLRAQMSVTLITEMSLRLFFPSQFKSTQNNVVGLDLAGGKCPVYPVYALRNSKRFARFAYYIVFFFFPPNNSFDNSLEYVVLYMRVQERRHKTLCALFNKK